VSIIQWALRHGVSAQALHELDVMFGIDPSAIVPSDSSQSEGAVQADVRLEAAAKGIHLFRNNVGVLQDKDGRPVRYGLANDSSKLNKLVKSGDLIGWRRVRIDQSHLGTVIAQFVSVECKRADWTYSGNEHEAAQLAWIKLINANGGDAKFCNKAGTL
jgi:hypothetical protein